MNYEQFSHIMKNSITLYFDYKIHSVYKFYKVARKTATIFELKEPWEILSYDQKKSHVTESNALSNSHNKTYFLFHT